MDEISPDRVRDTESLEGDVQGQVPRLPTRPSEANALLACRLSSVSQAIADDSADVWVAAKLAGLIHNITDPDFRL